MSRIANGRFRRLTPAVREVAQHANIRVEDHSPHDPDGKRTIMHAIDEAWDGSAAHAVTIAKLIRVAGSFANDVAQRARK